MLVEECDMYKHYARHVSSLREKEKLVCIVAAN